MGNIPADYMERCYAGWLGKIIGVRLGAPVEGWTYERIREKNGEVTDYLVDYRDFAADDDTNGPMFFLRALTDYGTDASAGQMGLTWLNYAPYEHGFYWWGGYGKSTEHTAYLNLRAGIPAPLSGSIAQNGAAVAEQIGGQIFIDTWGLVNPGDPRRAAAYGEKAASVSHDGNGKYGGMFVAACIAAAFVQRDIESVIRAGLGQIPQDCEFAVMARDIEAFYKKNPSDWHLCFRYIQQNWGYDRYPGVCHIIPNAAVMLLSMYYGQGDFSRTICICNMCGWDTDCNVGNVGAILGTMAGLDAIDEKWVAPVHDFLACSSVIGSLNIMDAPACVLEIARLAYAIAGEQPPKKYQALLAGHGARYHFELPRSTHSFRLEGEGQGVLENTADAAHTGDRSLFLRYEGKLPAEVYQTTYYAPCDFHDSRYDPAFSPILYPGQTVEAYAMAGENAAGLSACLFLKDRDGKELKAGESIPLIPGTWVKLSMAADCPRDSLIKRAGIRITGQASGPFQVYIDDFDFSGPADYAIRFAGERMEVWHPLHREVSQMTYLRGIWSLENGRLGASGTTCCEGYTGNYHWRDCEISSTFIPARGETFRLLFRVQGAIRSYAATLKPGVLVLEKNENGYRELCSAPFSWRCGEPVTLYATARGNSLHIAAGETSLDYTDEQAPYLYGQAGWGLENGRMLIEGAAIRAE